MSTPPFLELPEGVRAQRLPTARGDFAVLSAPAAGDTPRAPVLLVPGFTGSKEDFIAVLAPIAAAGHPVTALDLRGQFETPGGDDPTSYDVKELAEDLLSVVARVGGPVHLVGHSFGGLVGRAAALADPAALLSLTLLSSGPAAIPPPASSDLALMVQALPTTDLETIWTVKRQLELSSRPGPPPHIEDWLRNRFLANHPVSLRRIAEQLLDATDRTDELAAVDLPVLVAFGAGDEAWPPAVQRQMAARLDADLVVFAAAAHSPAAESPEATAEALVSFWLGTASLGPGRGDRVQLATDLGVHPSHVGLARRLVSARLDDWEFTGEASEYAVLLVSELVTNAMRHGGEPIRLVADITTSGIRVEVYDGNTDAFPAIRDIRPDAPGGRGLRLVDALADRWGTNEVAGDGKCVWFEIDGKDH